MRLITAILLGALISSCGPRRALVHDRLNDLEDRVAEVERLLDQYYNTLDALSNQVGQIGVDQDAISQAVALNAGNIASLENNTTVASVYDPCGDEPDKFDEVLLIMSDGTIIAYFETNGKRFLSSLGDGHYRTTDYQRCNFSIINGEIID